MNEDKNKILSASQSLRTHIMAINSCNKMHFKNTVSDDLTRIAIT